MQGYVHLYSGDGKGKTTAAIGLIIRQLAIQKNVALFQFLKDGTSSEINFLRTQPIQIHTSQMSNKFYVQMNEQEKQEFTLKQQQLWNQATKTIHEVDCLVLDEIMDAIQLNLLELSDLIHLIKHKPSHVEVIITAHQVEQELVDVVDYYTQFQCIKHPYQKGIAARKGIEY